MVILDGSVTKFAPEGMTIFVPSSAYSIDKACLQKWDKVQVAIPDGRTISKAQRDKAHAILHDICLWQEGIYTKPIFNRLKLQFKLDFVVNHMQALEKKLFSLSDCDMSLARDFITYLVDFAIEWAVPCKEPLWKNCEDIERYVYQCLMHKTCAVCGKERADLHHWDALGMGADRTKVYQIGWPVISLCRIHHEEVHSNVKEWLEKDMHLVPIPLTAEIGKVYGLTKKNLQKE